MIVTQTSDWDGRAELDVIICPQVSFEKLNTVRQRAQRKMPATLFVAMDMMEADTLRSDARVTSMSSIVEIMAQPYVMIPYTETQILSVQDAAHTN